MSTDDTKKANIDERKYWLDHPANTNMIKYAVYGICVLLILVDPFVAKHGDGQFAISHWFNFYGFFGLIAGAALVLIATPLRAILMRSEDYYDR